MKTIIVLAVLLLTGCKPSGEDPLSNRVPVGFAAQLSTTTYDGHKLIIAKMGSNGIGLMHHPDCPCLHQKDLKGK